MRYKAFENYKSIIPYHYDRHALKLNLGGLKWIIVL